MTHEQTLTARADVVEEILTTRHPGSPHTPMAVNCARNAVLAGKSAHAALMRGEEWIAALGDGPLRTEPHQIVTEAAGVKVHVVASDGSRAIVILTDYHTGKLLTVTIREVELTILEDE